METKKTNLKINWKLKKFLKRNWKLKTVFKNEQEI